MHAKRSTARHVIIKMSKAKDKERILKAVREQQLVMYREAPIRLSTDWHKIFKVMKSKETKIQSRLLYQEGYHLELKER